MSERPRSWYVKLALAAVLAGLCHVALLAGQVAKVKGEKAYKVGDKIKLVATDFPFKDAEYTWLIDGTGKHEYEIVNGALYVWAQPGQYKAVLTAISWTDKKLQMATYQFTVLGNGPAPVPPGPDPKPPDPDVPLSAFEKAVRAAYLTESDADKAKHAAALATVYRAAAREVEKQQPKTMGVVWKAIEAGAKAAGVGGKIMAVQKVIQKDGWGRLPAKASEVLDDNKRMQIVRVYDEIALALEKLAVKENGKKEK